MKTPKLPTVCAARLPTTGEPILIKRGETGYWPMQHRLTPEQFNESLGITKEQQEAMFAGSMFGWDCPAAQLKG